MYKQSLVLIIFSQRNIIGPLESKVVMTDVAEYRLCLCYKIRVRNFKNKIIYQK